MFRKTFRGGVHPAGRKELTVDRRIKKVPAPPLIILPLTQHTGAPNAPLCETGDYVRVGQRVGEARAYVSAPVHSPVSGTVKAIEDVPNPIYGRTPAILIENDGRNEPVPFEKREDPKSAPREKLIEITKKTGLVGLGGAAFPTHVKLNVPKEKRIDTLIVNGAECEPYLTCDHRLMVEKTKEIIKGIYLVAKILNVKNIFLAIEENKLSAVFAAEKVIREIAGKSGLKPIHILILKTKYPQGGEKQLIEAILKRRVPPGKLPLDVGVLVQNVGTCFSVYEAAYLGKPLIERCVTFSGGCLKEPGNFLVSLGTPIKHVVEYCDGFIENPVKIIVGGPMMGITQYSLDVPVIKGVTGVIFLSEKEARIYEELPCVRCGKCVDICPVNLLPTEIARMVKYSRWQYLDDLRPSDCIECGACAYNCASRIPLVQYIKLAKIKELERK